MSIFDQYSLLDPAKMLREIDAETDGETFDNYSLLDLNRARAQLAAAGIEVSNAAMLDPSLFKSELDVALDTGGGGGGDIPLAIVDFENAVYSVGATTYAVGDVLTGGDFNTGDISPSTGWFPQTDQFPNFGSVLSATLGNVAGLVIVVDAEAVDPSLGSLQVSLQNAASDVIIQFVVETNSGYTLSGPVTTIQNGDGDIPGRAKWGYRVSPSQFAIDATTKVEQDAVPDPSEFDVWTTNSYVEAGNAASWKIYSIKFYEASADLNSLVVA